MFELEVMMYLKENGKAETLRNYHKLYKRGIITLHELSLVSRIVKEN